MNLIKDYNIKNNYTFSKNIKNGKETKCNETYSTIIINDDSKEYNQQIKANENSHTFNNNNCQKNDYSEDFFDENSNIIFLFYGSTIEYLKKTEKLYNINLELYPSNNFIPKNKYNMMMNHDEQLKSESNIKEKSLINYNIENDKMSKNIKYNNYFFNQYKIMNKNINYNNNLINQNKIIDYNKNLPSNDITKTNSNSNNIINNTNFNIYYNLYINANTNILKNFDNKISEPPSIPSKFSEKVQTKNETKNSPFKETNKENNSEIPPKVDQNDKISPNVSEINKNQKDFFSPNEYKNSNDTNLDEKEYIVEMFGRKGWICVICNNFNYNIRVKCNRCGEDKKPKKIIDIKLNKEKNKEKNPKKGDWICSNCKNLNYSFRNVCNRCKYPKIYLLIKQPLTFQNINIFNNNCSSYYLFPNFIFFKNIPSIFINNIENTRVNNK